MSEINEDTRKFDLQRDELTVKELVLKFRLWYYYLISNWKIIILLGIIGGLVGFWYAYSRKPVYTAECTFVLEGGGKDGELSRYAGLASIVGFDIGGSNGIFQGENIFELYKSRLMLQKTLLTPAGFNGRVELLIDRYIESNNLRAAWAEKPDIAKIKFTIPKEKFTLKHDSIIGVIVNDINKNYLTVEKPDKKLSIVSVKVKSKDELFAKAFADKIVENVNDFYVKTKTKNSLLNVKLLQKQADSVRRALNSSIGATASAIDANPNANGALQTLRVPSQRKQIDVQASAAVYSEVVKNLEIAKISLRRETPLVQVIDQPILPLPQIRIGKVVGGVIGGMIAVLLSIFVLTLKQVF